MASLFYSSLQYIIRSRFRSRGDVRPQQTESQTRYQDSGASQLISLLQSTNQAFTAIHACFAIKMMCPFVYKNVRMLTLPAFC